MASQKQIAILNYIADTEKTRAQIVNRFHTWYYHNENFHIGNILSRMVKNGQLIRVKKGVYKANTEHLKTQMKKPIENIDVQQLDLF